MKQRQARTIEDTAESGQKEGAEPEQIISHKIVTERVEYISIAVGNFDGSNPAEWMAYVKLFEDICLQQGWDAIPETYLVSMLSGLLSGKAREAWHIWVRADHSILRNYSVFKAGLKTRLSDDTEQVWTKLMRFGSLSMKDDEDVEVYNKNYDCLESSLDIQGILAVKYFTSFSPKLRNLIVRHEGKLPDNPIDMRALAVEVAVRDKLRNIGLNVGPRVSDLDQQANVRPLMGSLFRSADWYKEVICFVCGKRDILPIDAVSEKWILIMLIKNWKSKVLTIKINIHHFILLYV